MRLQSVFPPRAVAFAVLVAASGVANGQSRWVRLFSDSTETWLVDQTRILAEGHDRYRFWTKIVYAAPRVISASVGLIDHQLIHERVQCGAELKAQFLAFTDYRGDSVIYSFTTPSTLEFEDVQPDTRGEYYYQRVCSLAHRVARSSGK